MSRLIYYSLRIMVPEARLELARCYQRGILNPLCLPIPPLGQTLYINDGNHVINVLIMEARPGVEPRSTDLQSAA